jgi:hypothetical protein
MTNDRPYRRAVGVEVAWDEIRRNAGGQFDPALVDLFETAFRERDLAVEREHERAGGGTAASGTADPSQPGPSVGRNGHVPAGRRGAASLPLPARTRGSGTG